MYDPKTIRRRRAVLAVLVVSSVVLLTASFGGSGGVGSVQRGVFEIVSPIQDVASRSLKPFRDLFGWFGDTWHAKGVNKSLTKQLDTMRTQNIDYQVQLRKLKLQAGINRVVATASLASLGPVNARVISAAPNLVYQRVSINKGTSSGVKTGQAVITGGGLIGRVDSAIAGYATVVLITDSKFGAEVRVAAQNITGTLRASGGDPQDLIVETTDPKAPVNVGDTIVTRGTTASARAAHLGSFFPPDVGIGRVSRVDDQGIDTQRVHVRPFVDVRNLDTVTVITRDASTVP